MPSDTKQKTMSQYQRSMRIGCFLFYDRLPAITEGRAKGDHGRASVLPKVEAVVLGEAAGAGFKFGMVCLGSVGNTTRVKPACRMMSMTCIIRSYVTFRSPFTKMRASRLR